MRMILNPPLLGAPPNPLPKTALPPVMLAILTVNCCFIAQVLVQARYANPCNITGPAPFWVGMHPKGRNGQQQGLSAHFSICGDSGCCHIGLDSPLIYLPTDNKANAGTVTTCCNSWHCTSAFKRRRRRIRSGGSHLAVLESVEPQAAARLTSHIPHAALIAIEIYGSALRHPQAPDQCQSTACRPSRHCDSLKPAKSDTLELMK